MSEGITVYDIEHPNYFDNSGKGINPYKFKKNDIIKSIYTDEKYKVVEPDKRGMAKLLNLQTNKLEPWNAYNNAHFILVEMQEVLP